jgi:succinoglycan biosynthesis protein ExoL
MPYPIARIAYFGHNRRDPASVRRIQSFLDAGVEVVTFTFRRDQEPKYPGPPWANVDLGHVEHARLLGRIAVYLHAIATVIRRRRALLDSDVVYARNLDIFAFAAFAFALAAPTASRNHSFVYECLDVHEALTKNTRVSALLRWIERRILNRACLLVVSSPGFLRHYFGPVQDYRGARCWVENKLYFRAGCVPPPREPRGSSARPDSAAGGAALTIGWIGIIRCKRTLDVLKALALARPRDVRVRIVGRISYFLIEDFDEQVAAAANIDFAGAYDWPDGLESAYRGVDIVFAQELSWKGMNSDWLIPNRIYEASYFGVPSLSVGDTETSRIVRERGLGYTLPDDSTQTLIDFVDHLDRAELRAIRKRLLDMPPAAFVSNDGDTAELLDAIRAARGGALK